MKAYIALLALAASVAWSVPSSAAIVTATPSAPGVFGTSVDYGAPQTLTAAPQTFGGLSYSASIGVSIISNTSNGNGAQPAGTTAATFQCSAALS